jgi:hypothetical protein
MLVEKLIGTAPYATFTELKNSARLSHYTHRATISYTDFTSFSSALTGTVSVPIFKSGGAEFGLLKGHAVREVVLKKNTDFVGLTSQATAKVDIGFDGGSLSRSLGAGLYSGGNGSEMYSAEYVDSNSNSLDWVWPVGAWTAGSKTSGAFSFAAPENLEIDVKLTCTVSAGTDKLDSLTAGEIVLYMELADMTAVHADGAWATVTL